VTPATPGPPVRWPAYREGQLLEVAELQAEQQARTGALTRHEGSVHTPGVAFGLQLTVSAVPGITGVDIQPGLAVDGAGHYLVLSRPLTASLADGESSVTISIVWRAGTSQIELSDVPPPAPADRASDAWPVVLGQADVSSGTVTVDHAAREELELRATAITAPAGGSRVILGGHGGRRAQVFGVQLADGRGGFGDVTTVDGDGTGRTTVPASVADAVQVSGSATLAAAIPAPSAASPWSLYRATVTRPDKTVAEQLRLEVGEVKTGVDPHALELLIAQGAGPDLLHVDAGGTVTISGGLTVVGVTTVSGWATTGPGGGTGATTLSGLAASEANVLAAAQALLNNLTNTDLKASAQGVSSAGGTVSYTLHLASSAATAVTDIAAYETVVVGGSVVSRQFVAQGVNLSPAGTADIHRAIPVGGTANIAVLAIGAGQDGQPRAATLSFSA